MMGILIHINGTPIVKVSLQRVNPVDHQPIVGEVCTYKIFYQGKILDNPITCSYGDAKLLTAKVMYRLATHEKLNNPS